MNRRTRHSAERDTFAANLKAAVTIVVVGVIVAITNTRTHPAPEIPPAAQLDVQTMAPSIDYFPSAYSLDAREPEELPPTF